MKKNNVNSDVQEELGLEPKIKSGKKNGSLTNTISLEKISSKSLLQKKEKIRKIVKDNTFDNNDFKRHKRDKTSIYLATLAVFVLIALIIGLLAWSFTG